MLSVACIHLYLLHDGQAKFFICVNKYFNGFQKNWTIPQKVKHLHVALRGPNQ